MYVKLYFRNCSGDRGRAYTFLEDRMLASPDLKAYFKKFHRRQV